MGQIVASKLERAGYVLAPGLASADFIFTYCLTQSQLEDVYLGSGGAVESAMEGCCLVDLSPSTVTLAKEIYAIARVNELQSLDAPLVLKDPCAHDAFGDSANVMMLAGGEDEAFAQAEPLLRVLADDVRYLGLPGSGQLAKSMCTVQQAAGVISIVEARAFASVQGEEGLDAMDAAVDAGLTQPGARSVYQAMLDRHFHGTYSCQVLMSELTAVIEAAEETDLVLPQTEACQQLLELFLVVGGSDLPLPALSLSYVPDEESASFGLDWSRARDIYEHDHTHGHDHDHGAEDEEYGHYDEFGYDYGYDDGEDGYAGGFGAFSSN